MTSTRLARACLVALIALALLHGLVQARLRPLYQVSDEVQYIFGAQLGAERTHVSRAACISPPDGSLLALPRGGGKWAFQAATAYGLTLACRDGGAFPLFVLRATSAVSLPVLASCAWMLARSLWPTRQDVAALAALLVATHPVIVKYGSGVTPDAWANALAGVAFVSGARLLLGLGRRLDIGLLVATTGTALVWKDTSGFLVVHLALVLTCLVWRAFGRHSTRHLVTTAVVGGIAGAVGISGLWRLAGTTYDVGAGVDRAARAPLAFAAASLADLLDRLPGMLASSWTSLGNFGGTSVPTVPTATAIALLTVAAAGLGWVGILVRPRHELRPLPAALAAVWAASALTCLLQPSVRQVFLDSQDVHQGRWLFPLVAPSAALVAAGVARLRPSPGWLALPGVLWIAVMWLTLGRLGEWYYARFPSELIKTHVFTRATGGYDTGEARLWLLVRDLASHQSEAGFWWPAALLGAGSVVCVWLLSTLASRTPNDRHPLHR